MILQARTSDVEAILQFKNRYPWKPSFPDQIVKKFLTDFISGPQMILEISDAQGLVGIAVILDRVQTLANDVCLEVLGLRTDVDPMDFIQNLVPWAQAKVPVGRNGFQLSLLASLNLNSDYFEKNNFEHYFDTYEMHRSPELPISQNFYPQICLARELDRDEVYKVLCDAFSQNKDTGIPDFKIWSLGFLKAKNSHFFLWKEKGQILGFATLFQIDEIQEAEIRTIGVLKKYRGLGIGRKLLEHCIKISNDLRLNGCHLTVSVSNSKALEIYLKSGFEVKEKFSCYRKSTSMIKI